MFFHFSLDLSTLDVRAWLPSNIQIFSLGAGHTMHGTLTTSYHTSIVQAPGAALAHRLGLIVNTRHCRWHATHCIQCFWLCVSTR